jgi:hypothetical protein
LWFIIIPLQIINIDNHQFQHPSAKMMMKINDNLMLGYTNVRSPPYNATGDGITDDTNAIQQALNDFGNMGGGIVFAPEGNYLIASQLTLLTATVLKGVASHVQKQLLERHF